MTRAGDLPSRSAAPAGERSGHGGSGATASRPRGDRWRLGPRGRRHPETAEVVARVTAVAAELQSGASPATAWERGLGVRTEDGLPRHHDLVRVMDDRAAAAVLAAARLAEEVGAAPAAVLERIAAALVEEAEAEARRRAAFAGPRATARLLAWLPLGGVVLGLALGARPDEVLLDGRGGTALAAVAALLVAAGRRWTGRHLAAAAAAGGRDG